VVCYAKESNIRQGDVMLIDIINKHLNAADSKCSFGAWLAQQGKAEQDGFELLMKKKPVNVASIYRSLTIEVEDLPFKSTTFKSHMRGDCKCQTN